MLGVVFVLMLRSISFIHTVFVRFCIYLCSSFCICCLALSEERAKAGRNCKTKRDRESPQGGIFSLFSASIGSSSDGIVQKKQFDKSKWKTHSLQKLWWVSFAGCLANWQSWDGVRLFTISPKSPGDHHQDRGKEKPKLSQSTNKLNA